MADVFRAWDRRLRTFVALKLLRPAFTTPEFRARLIQEAHVAATLQHPNIVRVLDVGEDPRGLFLAMELLDGPSLAEVAAAQGGRLPWRRVIALMTPILDALEVAHEQGLVHRDIKPGNIVVIGEGARERSVLIDFGIAKVEPARRLASGPLVTEVGCFLGTPAFAAPEQVGGGEVDPQVDVYAIGATIFRLIAGKLPGPRDGQERGPSLASIVPGVPLALSQVVSAALAPAPGQRPAGVAALREGLARAVAPARRRRGAWVVLAGASAAVVAGGWCVAAPSAEGATPQLEAPLSREAAVMRAPPAAEPAGPSDARPAGPATPTSATQGLADVPSRARPSRGAARAKTPREAPSEGRGEPEPAVLLASGKSEALPTPPPATLRSIAPALQRCFGDLGATLPMLLTLAVRISPAGAVLEVRGDNPNLRALEPCAAAAVRALTFAQAPAERWITESFTLTP